MYNSNGHALNGNICVHDLVHELCTHRASRQNIGLVDSSSVATQKTHRNNRPQVVRHLRGGLISQCLSNFPCFGGTFKMFCSFLVSLEIREIRMCHKKQACVLVHQQIARSDRDKSMFRNTRVKCNATWLWCTDYHTDMWVSIMFSFFLANIQLTSVDVYKLSESHTTFKHLICFRIYWLMYIVAACESLFEKNLSLRCENNLSKKFSISVLNGFHKSAVLISKRRDWDTLLYHLHVLYDTHR